MHGLTNPKCIVNKMGRRALDFSWLKVGTNAAFWRTRLGTFRFHKQLRISLLAEELPISQERLYCMVSVNSQVSHMASNCNDSATMLVDKRVFSK